MPDERHQVWRIPGGMPRGIFNTRCYGSPGYGVMAFHPAISPLDGRSTTHLAQKPNVNLPNPEPLLVWEICPEHNTKHYWPLWHFLMSVVTGDVTCPTPSQQAKHVGRHYSHMLCISRMHTA